MEEPRPPEKPPRTPRGEPVPKEELVPLDDRVIGQAFRWSLAIFAALALAGVAAWFLLRRPAVEREASAIAAAPPVAAAPLSSIAPPQVTFTDVTVAAGIDFVHFDGATGEKLLPETMGGGAAFFDLDRDGDQDLLFVNGTHWPHDSGAPRSPDPALVLYRNQGGRFSRVADAPRDRFYGMGAAAGDFDGDGWTDVFVTAVGENRLYRNAQGTLVDVTGAAGVAGDAREWSTGAAFVDVDRDGDLDLFVVNYVRWSRQIDLELDYRLTGVGRAYGPPLNYEGTHPYLYRNEGDGTFTDVSAAAGVEVANPATGVPVAKGMAVAPLDVDRDGWIDLFVANDTVRKFLFHNRGDGTFEETAELWGLAYDRDGAATGAMGIDAGHFRNDAEIGLLIGNFANEMTSLYVSQGDPTLYADEAITEGIGAPTRLALSFGLFLFDYDLDGRLDLLQNNGHLEEEIATVDPSQSYRQRPQLFWNAGPGVPRSFVLVPSETTGDLDRPIVGRGSTYADVDADGDLDVLLLQVGGPPLLLRNDQALGHHWVRFRLVGRAPNRDAIGAWIELTAGGVTQRRQVMPTRSYLSQVELPVTFGLGEAVTVDSVLVTWPDGTTQPVENVVVDTVRVVEQG